VQAGLVTFWSRTRQALWTKGETSGNHLRVRRVWIDCDDDTLLIEVDPVGPTCHTGARSCFFQEIVGLEAAGQPTGEQGKGDRGVGDA
jgi:phosphoribosyl-AMP cyclohydrolase